MEDKWKHYQLIDFTNKKTKQYNVDTRDFHVLESENTEFEGLDKILSSKNRLRFFFTENETKELLNRLFTESGGDCKWRFLSLIGEGKRVTTGWQIKYIRIIRTEHGLLICDNHKNAIRKDIWSYPVNKNPHILCNH